MSVYMKHKLKRLY